MSKPDPSPPSPTKEAVIYCDGSSSSQTRLGGYCALVATPDFVIEITGSESNVTNNRMEMIAALRGLEELKESHKVYLVSDSAYLLNTIKNQWYLQWFTDTYTERPNLQLWRYLVQVLNKHEVHTVKVKGHAGDKYNEWVDKAAVKARVNQIPLTRRVVEENEGK